MHLPRHCDVWLPGYIRARVRQMIATAVNHSPGRVWVMIADHFEPLCGGVSDETAAVRVLRWRSNWPRIARAHADSDGRHPVYTFFYPEEEYRPALIDPLAAMRSERLADVEVHVHHDRDSAQQFTDRIGRFIAALSARHGLLRRENGRIRFGFIHGNWALANSLPGGRWCGVDNEITLLRDLGCYADFTMPAPVREAQARMVNRLYWATDSGNGRKAHDTGRPLDAGGAKGDLLIIPGPIGFRWRERLIPRIEVGQIAGYDMPNAYRAGRWLDIAPRIRGDIFLKLFTHGAQERNMVPLLGGGLSSMFDLLSSACRRRGLELRYVSAWEMYRAAIAAWSGADPVAEIRGTGAAHAGARAV